MRYFGLLLLLFFSSVSYGQSSVVWSTTLTNTGSFSSPRATDLNGDGIKDIVLGAGKKEFLTNEQGVVALDGKTGSILWSVKTRDQVFGSPSFMDITGDDVDDIFINGRSGILKAINGRTGTTIWDFYKTTDPEASRAAGWYNFYNPQFISDIDADGINDIVISNGGDVRKAPFDPDRPTGHLALISGKSGKLISKAPVPDGKETYLSLVVHDFSDSGNPEIVFGTGGETLPGSLFITDLEALKKGDISSSKRLASSETKGFIAPPALVDLTGDQTLDIVANSVDGRVLAFDGRNKSLLWSTGKQGTEIYTSLGIGRLNDDTTPDIFTTYNTGIWPIQEYAVSWVVDGKTGRVFKSDTVGYYQMVSPVLLDIDNNGYDEVILHSNFPHPDQVTGKVSFTNSLLIYDFKRRIAQRIGPSFDGSNGAATPWIGDLDNDGLCDIVFLYQTDVFNEDIFEEVKIVRYNLGIKIPKKPLWGSYMGSFYNGIYEK